LSTPGRLVADHGVSIIRTNIHTETHTHARTHTHRHTHTHTHIYTHTHTHKHAHTHERGPLLSTPGRVVTD
jgi:hypothetical protein